MKLALPTILGLAHLGLTAPTTNSSTPNIVLANQLGPYPVSIYSHEIRTSRPDLLAPTPQTRRLMVTIYRPFLDTFTCPPEHRSLIPWVDPEVRGPLLELLQLPISPAGFEPLKVANCSAPVPNTAAGPLVLFSHGYRATHHVFASYTQALASSGYTVVSLDHTYEAAAVVFPDGEIATTSEKNLEYNSNVTGIQTAQSIRTDDAISVLDAIEAGEVLGLGRSGNTSSTPLRAVMYGSSFGGSTAANVAAADPRILGAINFDGNFYGPVGSPPLGNGTSPPSKPLLMLGSDPQTAEGWEGVYASATGWKSWVRVNNTVHYSFTDIPLVADLLGARGTLFPEELLTGSVDSRRLQEVMWRLTERFVKFAFGGERDAGLEGPSEEFADVSFVEFDGGRE